MSTWQWKITTVGGATPGGSLFGDVPLLNLPDQRLAGDSRVAPWRSHFARQATIAYGKEMTMSIEVAFAATMSDLGTVSLDSRLWFVDSATWNCQ